MEYKEGVYYSTVNGLKIKYFILQYRCTLVIGTNAYGVSVATLDDR